ncbi:GlxA family transcriptional regulator [Pelagibacterium lentulum]|uniref:AraC family transcriptional regulator n=1 Tax=Pelagibacterium lentulum TaxID=2029865 RepID=A0A916RAW8_9HYPH|nr:helix-turn-helix domain-containing protein [Pelagibacterium lentulum]GGA46759.1 AraC family transcriptional regulator [Pelagibacterium lentulum]
MSLHPDKRPRVHVLASAETSALVLYGLLDVLGSVGAIYSEVTTGNPGEPLFSVKVAAENRDPFRCFGHVIVEPDEALADIESTDIAIVCDMYQPIDRPPFGLYRAETAWLRRMYEGGALVASVCSGSLILAEAGLLDGMETAGHWCYAQTFRDYYPKVVMREDLALCCAGPDERIITTGAVSAWQDLALYLIARFCGHEHAVQTANIYLFSEHAEGQLPYVVSTPRIQSTDAAVRDAQIWIADNYATHNPVGKLAHKIGLSQRNFTRRFRAATGITPLEYVQLIRVEEAKQLLETGRLSIEDAGYAVGYDDPTSFGRLFKRRTGLTPAAYRRKFATLTAINIPAQTKPDFSQLSTRTR